MVMMMMKALAAMQFGAFGDVLSWQDIASPAAAAAAAAATTPNLLLLQPHEVLVQVAWSDMNPVDLQKLHGGRRSGQPISSSDDDATTKTYFVPGFAGSGVVLRQGDDTATGDNDHDSCDVLPRWETGDCVAFLVNPSSSSGSYAEYCIVDCRAMARIPSTSSMSLRDAATVPLAGCTAYESLCKLQLGPPSTTSTTSTTTTSTKETKKKTLLIVGGAGGVGSWATRLARAWHPQLEIIVTTSQHADWCCQQNGASRCLRHDKILQNLAGGVAGSVDAILCLTEPTTELMKTMSEVIRPYGHICLVVAGASIQSLDCGFLFFKSAHLSFETVFSCFRTNFGSSVCPGDEIADMLELVASGQIPKGVPLSPLLLEGKVDEDWKQATVKGGILDQLQGGHVPGKLVMRVGGANVSSSSSTTTTTSDARR